MFKLRCVILIINVSLLLCQSGFSISTLRTVFSWALGIFYQTQLLKLGNYKEHLARRLAQARSQICFCPRHLFGKNEYIYTLVPGNYHLSRVFETIQSTGSFPFWTELFWVPLVKSTLHLVLAATQRSNLWGDKDSLGPSACRCVPWLLPIDVYWVTLIPHSLCCWASSSKADFVLDLPRYATIR